MSFPLSVINPVYSHGGANAGPWTAVSGTVTGGGRPVFIANIPVNVVAAGVWPAMQIFCASGTATVKIEGNSGILTTGSPSSLPSGEWVDLTSGGISMGSGDTASKICPPDFLFYRTNIVTISGATVTSYMGNAPWFNLCYPTSS